VVVEVSRLQTDRQTDTEAYTR